MFKKLIRYIKNLFSTKVEVPVNDKVYVLAKSHRQAIEFLERFNISYHQLVYINHFEKLLGLRDITIYLTGQYYATTLFQSDEFHARCKMCNLTLKVV